MIPFTDNSAHITDDFCTERRLAETLAFIKPEDFAGKVWVDIGEYNYAAKIVESHVGRISISTYGDLNSIGWEPSAVIGQTVTCFEVIEHLMNPLQFLQGVRGRMAYPAVLYLSTPVHNRFGFYFNETNHFTEYKESSLRTLVEYAGFRITDYHQFRSIPFWKGMKQGGGIVRTALRVSSQRTQILRAVKI